MAGLHYLDNQGGDLAAIQNLGSSLGNMRNTRRMIPLIQLQMQMRQQALAQQAALNEAHRALYGAQTERAKESQLLDATRRARVQMEIEQAAGLGKAMSQQFPVDMSQGPTMEAAQQQRDSDLAGRTAEVASRAPTDIVKQVMQLRQGMQDPMMANLIATGQHPVMNVPQGGSLIDLPTGSPLAFGQARPPVSHVLSPGSMLVGEKGQTLASAPGRSLTPQDPFKHLKTFQDLAEFSDDPEVKAFAQKQVRKIMSGDSGTAAPAATSTGLRYSVEPVP